MNNNSCYQFIHKIGTGLAVIMFLIGMAGCASSVHFERSSVVPAAEGTVKIKKDKNNNYEINLSVIRLAEPGRLHPPGNIYVAWMETKDYGLKNLGRLHVSSGFLSKTLKGSLQTVTTFKPVRIFITAEEKSNIQYPGTQLVLTTNTLK